MRKIDPVADALANVAATTTTPPSWNANVSTFVSTPSTVNTTPDARVNRAAKRRSRSQACLHPGRGGESGESHHHPCPSELYAQDEDGMIPPPSSSFSVSRAGRSGGIPLHPYHPASPKHDTRAPPHLSTH